MLHSASRCECQPGGLSTFTGLWKEMGTSPGFLAQSNMIISPTRNNTIGGAPTLESGGNVSGKASVSRGAQPGPGIAPNQVNPERVGDSQADSRFNATGTPPYEPAPTPSTWRFT